MLSALERLHALKRAGSQVAINAREAVRFLDRVTSGKDNVAAERVILQGPMEQYEKWEDAEKFFLPEFEEEEEAETGDREMNGDEPVSSASSHEKRGEAKAAGKTKGRTGKKEATASPDDLSQMLLSKLNFKKESDAVSNTSAGTHSAAASRTSSRSSRTSPECANGVTDTNGNGSSKQNKTSSRTNGHQRTASGSTIPTVPQVLRPLLSAVLWRLHGGPEASNVAKSCILVSNDPVVQSWAQKFGIGVKNIHQLRTSIQYEEREFKNRCKYVEKTQGQGQSQNQGQVQGQGQTQVQGGTEPTTILSYDDESEEDELVFVPRGRGKGSTRGGGTRGGGSNRKAAAAAAKTVAPPPPPPLENTVEVPVSPIDPDSFSRSLGGPTSKPKQQQQQQQQPTPVVPSGTPKASRGRRGGSRGSSRGNGRGRGKLWVP